MKEGWLACVQLPALLPSEKGVAVHSLKADGWGRSGSGKRQLKKLKFELQNNVT